VPAADDRRTPGNKFMQSLGREHCADAYPKGLWEVLSAWPVFNHHTVMACPPRQTPPCSTGPRRTTASTYDTAAMLLRPHQRTALVSTLSLRLPAAVRSLSPTVERLCTQLPPSLQDYSALMSAADGTYRSFVWS
jgi:hypothetical protein